MWYVQTNAGQSKDSLPKPMLVKTEAASSVQILHLLPVMPTQYVTFAPRRVPHIFYLHTYIYIPKSWQDLYVWARFTPPIIRQALQQCEIW